MSQPAPPSPSITTINTSVLVAIVIIAALDVVAGIIVPAIAPAQALPILTSVFGFSLTIITLLFAVLRVNAVGQAVDGKMTELLEMRGEIAALRATATEKDRRAGEDAGTALATAAASDTHTQTTTTTTLNSPPTLAVPVAVAPPAAVIPLEAAPPDPPLQQAYGIPANVNLLQPTPYGPPVTPGSFGPDPGDPPPETH